MVGQRAVRVHAAADDLAHRVRDHHVDPLEGGDDRLVRRGERPGVGHEPDVAAAARARLVDEPRRTASARWAPVGMGWPAGRRCRGRRATTGRRATALERCPAAAASCSASSRLGGTSTRISVRAGVDRGDRPRPGRRRSPATRATRRATAGAASPSSARSSRRAVAVGVDPLERRAGERVGVGHGARPAGRDRRAAPPPGPGRRCRPPPRAPAPCGGRSYSAMAIANGRAMPPPRRRGSGREVPVHDLGGERAAGAVDARRPRTGAGSPAPARRSCGSAAAPHADGDAVARARRPSRSAPSPSSCMAAVWRRGAAGA